MRHLKQKMRLQITFLFCRIMMCHFTVNVVLILLIISSCVCQQIEKIFMVNATAPLPVCSHFIQYATVRTATDNDNSRSLIIPKSRIVTQLGGSSIPINFQLQINQKLKCDEEKSETRTVILSNVAQDPGKLAGRSFRNVINATDKTHQISYFTSSGYFYDSKISTYYKPDGDYCISSYSSDDVTLKVCTFDHQYTSPLSSPNIWLVPKCCALDEVFFLAQSQCSKFSASDGASPWIPPIYKSHHKINGVIQNIRFQMASLPKNCNSIRFDNNSETSPFLRWTLASTVTIRNRTVPKGNIKLAAPEDGLGGVIRPLEFYPASRTWKEVQNLEAFCVEGFYVYEGGPVLYKGKDDEFVLVICQRNKPPSNDAENSSFLSKLNSLAYTIVVVIGAMALLTTIVIYGLNWDKLNLHGLLILSFTVAALGDYLCIGVLGRLLQHFQTKDVDSFGYLCYGTSVLSHYFLLVSYLWLTILNFDLWLNFKSIQAVRSESKQWKKFSLYSLSTWGFTFALVAVFVIIDNVYIDPTTEVPVPGYGTINCYVSPYFAGHYIIAPLLILFVINILLIAGTTKVFLVAKRERSRRLSAATSNARKYSLKMFAKLFTVMGLGYNGITLLNFLLFVYFDGYSPWPLVVVRYIVYLTPVYLFVLFCLNDRVISQLKDKYPKLSKWLDFLRTHLKLDRKGRSPQTTLTANTSISRGNSARPSNL